MLQAIAPSRPVGACVVLPGFMMVEYQVPAYSARLAQKLQAAGMDGTSFNLLLTGGSLPSHGSMSDYVAYCSNAPVDRFDAAGAHVGVAKRMELVLRLIDAASVNVPQHAAAIRLLVQVALIKFPVGSADALG